MPYPDFESDKERIHMPDTVEKTPGVYVRTNEPTPQELDMLWSGSRIYHKEERSPLLFFLGGFIFGVLLTLAAVWLLTNIPKIETGESDLTAPVQDAAASTAEPAADSAKVEQPAASATSSDASTSPSKTTDSGALATHSVSSGDTLGSIAYKYYGSSAPEFVEKIARANKMKPEGMLNLDQKLVIPPKGY